MFYDSDDCLWLFRLISIDMYLFKPMKVLLKLTFYIVVVLTGIQTVMFLKKSETYYFVKCQPIYFGSFFIEPWPINRLGHVLERRIKRQSIYFNILLIVITVVSLVSGILHALPIEDDEEIFYTLAFFQEYFPRCQRFLCFVYRMGFVLLSIVMPAPFLISIYVGCHAQYQICMLVHVLKTVNKVNQTEESDLLLDKNYQEKTKNLLKFCIKRHCQLTHADREAMKEVQILAILFCITTSILFICMIIFIFSCSFREASKGRYLRLPTLIFPAGVIFVHIFFLAQGIENMGSFKVLLQSSWYNWNKENKMIYLMFLTNCKNPYKLRFSNSFSVDYELAVSILKSVYSVLSVLGYWKR
ncbi:hypothetical protein Zmor_000455 [Zophobas morio]|uniref:Odorant receptor n=1 Tax=Zophobas morio TaxID=2755281 RepID=A0AA38IWM6_9CUCU|nr:hypothetical protein Zmor_000455 [Zophobas morio]